MQLENIYNQRRRIERTNAEIRKEVGACRTAIGHHKNSIRKNEKKISGLMDELTENQIAYEKLGKVLFTLNQI